MGRSEMKVGCKEHSTRVMKREGGFRCGKPWPVEDHREVSRFVIKELKGAKPLAWKGSSPVIPFSLKGLKAGLFLKECYNL